MPFHRTKRYSLTFFTFLIFFIVFNVFLYSLISIGLYKLICYEKQSELLKISLIDKDLSIFYVSLTEILDTFISSVNFSFSKVSWSVYLNQPLSIREIESKDVFFFDIKSSTHLKWPSIILSFNQVATSQSFNLIFMNFFIRSSNLNWIQSLSLQKTILMNFNESSLFFFRIYNPSHLSIKLITLYMIYPNLWTLYINKIQCFRFNSIFLFPLEMVDLPVLIYVYPFFNHFDWLNNIIIYYIIFLN